ncbi:MAG TPA: hypothetical protein VLG50_05970 [Candidatus Saccharimonadales bacterium]|nr:hypothetical protein [Candidatus Saccharimonadales bacterium]
MSVNDIKNYINNKVKNIFGVTPTIEFIYENTTINATWLYYTLMVTNHKIVFFNHNMGQFNEFEINNVDELYNVIDYIFDTINPKQKH